MTQNPFTKRPAYEGLYVAQRRSTRVDWVTPIILTGRDASGHPFREQTETVRVNLHGAKIKTHHRVMVGAQINIENPLRGLAEKAICVSVEEAPPGQTEHAIGVQLVRPQNLWGIEHPPPDWERVLSGQTANVAPREYRPETVAPHSGPVFPSSSLSSAPSTLESPAVAEPLSARFEQELAEQRQSFIETLRRHTLETTTEAIAKSRQEVDQGAAEAARQIDARLTHLLAELNSALETFRAEVTGEVESLRGHSQEIATDAISRTRQEADQAVTEAARQIGHRLNQSLAELNSALETFRTEAMGDIVREAVHGFEDRTAALVGDMENRLAQRGYQALSELERVLEGFRTGIADELMARKKETVEAAEQELRSKIASMLSTILDASAGVRTIEAPKPSVLKK